MEVSLAAGLGNVDNVHATLQQLTQQGGALQQQIGALQQNMQQEFQNVQQEFQNVQQQLHALQHGQQSIRAWRANVAIRKENKLRAKHELLPPVRLQRELVAANGGEIGEVPQWFPATFLAIASLTTARLNGFEEFYSTTFPGQNLKARREAFSDFIQ